METCWTKSKRKFTIRFKDSYDEPTCLHYPLDMAREYKTQHDLTWQQLANELKSVYCQFQKS